MDTTCLRQIPKMDKLLSTPEIQAAGAGLPRTLVREALQAGLDTLRSDLLQGAVMPENTVLYAALAARVRDAGRFRLRPVINATGIVLHTNLGRAPLGSAISQHVAEIAAGYSNLEFDLQAGKRGSRYAHIEALLCKITGAEAALVVNNNAAAVFLMLDTLASGKRVAVSRGELVEIGGSFRVPEIMRRSGAELMEIGTTNKTHFYDYENAITAGAGALLKVHTSNFTIQGFTEEVPVDELAPLAHEREIPLLYDVGSGFLLPPSNPALRQRGVDIPAAVAAADVVCFSGDKLTGGGQAGILLGRSTYISAMKRNQVTRMLRTDKLTLAALEAVLRCCLDRETALKELPVYAMLEASSTELKDRAAVLEQLLLDHTELAAEAVPCDDEPGGGSLPGVTLPGWAVAVRHKSLSANQLEQLLRQAETPIICRIHEGRVLLSVRTLLPGDEELLLAALADL